VPGNRELGATTAAYLVYIGLAERGWPRGTEPAKPDSLHDRFAEWRRNVLKGERHRPDPPGYRLTELGWKILERGQYAHR
jgi:hypothetical protein